MICRKLKSRLSAYQDGELDRKTREQVRRHLDHCPDCRHEYSLLTALREAVGPPPPEPEFSSVTAAVMTAIRRQTAPHPRRILARAGVFLAALVVFIAVVVLFNGRRPVPRELDLGDDEALVSLLIDKEGTSAVGISQDLVESILPKETGHER